MLNNQTVEKLRDLKLKIMANMLSNPDNSLKELSFEERLGIMVENEWISKKNSRIKRLINTASLGLNAYIEDIDYTTDRKLDKKIIQQKLNIVIRKNRNRKNICILCPWQLGLPARLCSKILQNS